MNRALNDSQTSLKDQLSNRQTEIPIEKDPEYIQTKPTYGFREIKRQQAIKQEQLKDEYKQGLMMQIEENRLRKEKEKKLRELEEERLEMRAR